MDPAALATIIVPVMTVLWLIIYVANEMGKPLPAKEERPPWDAANWTSSQWTNYNHHLNQNQKHKLMGATGRKQLRAAAKGERKIYWVPSGTEMGKLKQISADSW